MRSIFAGIILLSASIAVVPTAQAQQQPQGPQTQMGYRQLTGDDLKAIERDNQRNDLPASQNKVTGAAPVQSEENALTNRVDQDNARLDRLVRGICPTC
jgi:hypothetical protein